MTTFKWGNWDFGVDLGDLIDEAIFVHARVSDWTHLAIDDTTLQNTFMAKFVNKAIEEFLEAIPTIGRKTYTQALTADTIEYAMQTDLHGVAIERCVREDGVELKYLSTEGYYALSKDIREGTITQAKPDHWFFKPDTMMVGFLPAPSASVLDDVDITYRQEHTEITAANVLAKDGNGSATTIGELPERYATLVALRIAVDVKAAMEGKSEESLILRARYDEDLKKAQRVMGTVRANTQKSTRLFIDPHPHRF